MSPAGVTRWTLQARAAQRFLGGHPWVFSNELTESPKGINPGDPIELCSISGQTLARGYGHPDTLIAFRTLTRDTNETDPWSEAFLAKRLLQASGLRKNLGMGRQSNRLCYAEADGLPGLIIDAFRRPSGWVFSCQLHTAGAERWASLLPGALNTVCEETGALFSSATVLLLRKSSGRKFEGLALKATEAVHGTSDGLEESEILLSDGRLLRCDLIDGQKSGFFLDQSANVQRLVTFLRDRAPSSSRAPFKALDLFCYVAQWGAAVASLTKSAGITAEVWCVDSSEGALSFAAPNIEASGGAARPHRMDLLERFGEIPDKSFDVVLCDPPAFIKGRKDFANGRRAYLRSNTEAIKKVKPGGLLATSSCAGLLAEASFVEMLAQSSRSAGRTVHWVAWGCQAPDHPTLAAFPEGRYLKTAFGVVS